MQKISRKELIEMLNRLTKITITICMGLDMRFNIVFAKFGYTIEEDVLDLRDLSCKNNISFNLNNVKFMGKENEQIVFILDDKKDTIIKIKSMPK